MNQWMNLTIELALFNTVLRLRFPKIVLSPATPFSLTSFSMSWPLGQPVRPRAKIVFHFSSARFHRASVISDSARVSLKSITS